MPATYDPTGFGVELEFTNQRFINNSLLAPGQDPGVIKRGSDNIKGTPLDVAKRINAQNVEHIPGSSVPGEWDLTAEHIGETKVPYAEFRGEYIINGLTVHVEQSDATAKRIDKEIKAHYGSWDHTQGEENEMEITIKRPNPIPSDWPFENAGVWKVTKTPHPTVVFTTHITTAMPLKVLLLDKPPACLTRLGFTFFRDFALEWQNYVCTTEVLRAQGVLATTTTEVPDDLRAFITLCSVYADRGPRQNRTNGPKESFSLVPRNDFVSLFTLVNGKQLMQDLFQGEFKTSLLAVVAKSLNQDTDVLGKSTFKWSGSDTNQLSIKDWLDGLSNGKDLLTEKDSKKNWGDSSIGRFGSKWESIGNDNTKPAPIWEFRNTSSLTLSTLDSADGLAKLNNQFWELSKLG